MHRFKEHKISINIQGCILMNESKFEEKTQELNSKILKDFLGNLDLG